MEEYDTNNDEFELKLEETWGSGVLEESSATKVQSLSEQRSEMDSITMLEMLTSKISQNKMAMDQEMDQVLY